MAGSPKKQERRARFEAWITAPEEAMDELVEWMAEMGDVGHLTGFCKVKDVSYTAVMSWIDADSDRAELYARAREARIEAMAAESLAIVDEAASTNPITGAVDSADIAHKKLRADHRRWLLSKLAPKRYGDKLELDATLKHDVVGELRAFLDGSRLKVRHQSE
jgi:hypothetical protein